ncbi:MAG: hypothetical protein ABIK47_05810 [candidate division WOR-3 bacterium]
MVIIIGLLLLPLIAGAMPDRVQKFGYRNLPFNPDEAVEMVTGENQGFQSSHFEGGFLIDTNIVCFPEPNSQMHPSVGFDGTNFLVVWGDRRNGPSSDIYGARVSRSGMVLDPKGIPISTAPGSQGNPSVSFDGTNYLVVWEDTRNGYYYDIYGARVTRDGVVLDTSGIPISNGNYDQRLPSVGFDDINYLVVWEDNRSGSYHIYGTLVTKDGEVLDPDGIAISNASGHQVLPYVDFDGINYLVVWQDHRSGSSSDIYGARVSRYGNVLDLNGIPISTAPGRQYCPSVAFDGTNYLVAWEDKRSNPDSLDIYGARVTRDGVVLDTSGIPISTAPGHQYYPSVAFDGTNYLVVWYDHRTPTYDIYGARVSQDGNVLDTSGIPISTAPGHQYYPSVAFDGTNYLVVWEDYRNKRDTSDIYGTRVNQGGTVLDSAGIPISVIGNYQGAPSVSFDGTNYLVVWQDKRSGSSFDIYGARVSQDGVVLDPNGIRISTAAYSQESPSVAFDNTNYLVVWQDNCSGSSFDIYAARVAKNGEVLDSMGIVISSALNFQLYPSVGFDGTNYLVVWQDNRSGFSYDIYGARVSRDGNVLDLNGIPISTAPGRQYCPSVAFDGTNYLVVWEDNRSGSSFDIYAARVSQEGMVVDTAGIPVSTAYESQRYPSVAFDGTNYLVVWQDLRRNGYYCDIYGARVSQDGVVLDPNGIRISTAAYSQKSPSVIFDGTNYLVVWEDNRSGSFYNIYGARVTPGGVVFDSGLVVRQEWDQSVPALACGQESGMFLVYQSWAGKVGGKNYNTQRIWGKMNPTPGIEEYPQPEVKGSHLPATVVRNVLRWTKTEDRAQVFLVDVTGRKVLELKPGENDVRHLSPGVYFIRDGSAIERKVAIAR